MKGDKPSSEPATYWCYKVSDRKEDLWLATCGCIGDGFLPDFANDAAGKYPELFKKVRSAFEGLYETELGKITQILNFSLKDRTSNVVKMLRFMFSAFPADVLDEGKQNKMLARYEQINKKYQKLLEKAMLSAGQGRLLYFQYGGELSISADIANELSYRCPGKIVVIAYLKGTKVNISLRGKINMRKFTEKAIEGIGDATGGGHEHATGAQVQVEDLPKFKENLDKLVKEIK